MPSGVALAEDLGDLPLNPAALGWMRGIALVYDHERDLRTDRLGDGLSLAGRLSALRLGLGLEWLRLGGAEPNYRKTRWTVGTSGAFGTVGWALGLGYNRFGSSDPTIEALETFDAGVQVRPWSWLSLGAVARELNRATVRSALGVAVRPGTDRLQLSADYGFADRDLSSGRVALAGAYEFFDGARLRAGWEPRMHGGGTSFQLGLQLDTDSFGLGYAYGNGGDHRLQARLSTETHRPMTLPGGRYLWLDLPKLLSPREGLVERLLSPALKLPFFELLALLARIEEDASVEGVVVRFRSLPLGFAQAEELKAALERLHGTGRKVVAYLEEGGDAEYYAATGADRIIAAPQASLQIDGLSLTSTFLGEGLAKLGVAIDVARTGPHKSAPDALIRSGMSDEERQMLDAYLDRAMARYTTRAALARRMETPAFTQRLSQAIFTAKSALAAGLVDEVASIDDFGERLDRTLPSPYDLPRVWGAPKRLAIVPILGSIAEGESHRGLLGGQVSGSDTIVRELDRARMDGSIAAVVLRIDSGGGSVAASQLIGDAVARLRQVKPVVVSMGAVAASGGYWVALPADRIFAEPQTMTGSIGVFVIKPSFEALLAKLGIHAETLKRGDSADLFSVARRWTPAQQALVERHVGELYGEFTRLVAEHRHLPISRVEELAGGRVWSGEDAFARGLVDELGGMREAMAAAWAKAGGSGPLVLERAMVAEGSPGSGEAVSELAALSKLVPAGAREFVELGAELGDAPAAVMPWAVEVR